MANIDHRRKERKFTQYLDENQKEIIMAFINEYDGYLSSISNSISYKCQKLEAEDIKQQIILVLLSSVKHFDGRCGTSYSTYLCQIALNEGKRIIRQYWQYKNRVNAESVSLDNYIGNDDNKNAYQDFVFEDDTSLSNPEVAYEKNLILEKIKTILEGTKQKDREILIWYIEGYSIKEICKLSRRDKYEINSLIKVFKKQYQELSSKGGITK